MSRRKNKQNQQAGARHQTLARKIGQLQIGAGFPRKHGGHSTRAGQTRTNWNSGPLEGRSLLKCLVAVILERPNIQRLFRASHAASHGKSDFFSLSRRNGNFDCNWIRRAIAFAEAANSRRCSRWAEVILDNEARMEHWDIFRRSVGHIKFQFQRQALAAVRAFGDQVRSCFDLRFRPCYHATRACRRWSRARLRRPSRPRDHPDGSTRLSGWNLHRSGSAGRRIGGNWNSSIQPDESKCRAVRLVGNFNRPQRRFGAYLALGRCSRRAGASQQDSAGRDTCRMAKRVVGAGRAWIQSAVSHGR